MNLLGFVNHEHHELIHAFVRINEIVHGKRSVTADTDLRLSRALGTSEGFWLGLQSDYDLEEKKAVLKSKLEKIKSLVSLDNAVGDYMTR